MKGELERISMDVETLSDSSSEGGGREVFSIATLSVAKIT